MVIADVSATGDDNVLSAEANDLAFRKEQLHPGVPVEWIPLTVDELFAVHQERGNPVGIPGIDLPLKSDESAFIGRRGGAADCDFGVHGAGRPVRVVTPGERCGHPEETCGMSNNR